MNDQNMVNSTDVIMTVQELAHYLRLSRAKVYRMAKMGRVPAFRIGKSWRFRKEAIDDWIWQETRQVYLHSIDPAVVEPSKSIAAAI